MRCFMRQKTIDCGKQYREIDIFPYTSTQQEVAKKGKRATKEKVSVPKQRNLNDKNAKRFIVQSGEMNFGKGDVHITATHNKNNHPETIEEAEKIMTNYLRRVKYRRKVEGLPPLKYILVTSNTGKEGAKPTHIHHHIIMNGGLDRDLLEDMWTNERIYWKKYKEDPKYRDKIKRIGFINADRLQPDENGISALCVYLAKHPNRKKRWSTSQNLKRPTSLTNDTCYSRRKIEKIAKERPDRAFWEKKYPGWTLTDDDYGVEYKFYEEIGWSIYLKLRKKE